MNNTSKSDVQFQHPLYEQHKHQVKLCNDLYNGYDTAKQYLMQSTNEHAEDFAIRVELATFNNVFERIITAQVGQIFRKPIVYDDVPDKITEWLEELDFDGNLHDVVTNAETDGLGLILIDLPRDGGDPYLLQIRREQLINWRINKDGEFTMAVICESYQHEEGFKIEYRPQYRVLHEDGNIDIWREVEGEGFQIVESITTSYDFLPLYAANLGATPPLYNIAVMNKNLYNCSSMTANSIRKATDPSLLTVGLGLEDGDSINFGVNATINTDNEEARVEWIELKGESIPIAKQDLKDQETTIGERALNMQSQSLDASNKTATQVNKENSESNARLSDISAVAEITANKVYAGLVKIKYNQEPTGEIEFAFDFKDEGIANNLLPSINQAWVSGMISHKTALTTLVEKEQLIIKDIDSEIKQAELEFTPEEVEVESDSKEA